MRMLIGAIIVIWLVIGVVAAGQRVALDEPLAVLARHRHEAGDEDRIDDGEESG